MHCAADTEHGDPVRDERYRSIVSASPGGIARDLTTWLSTRG
jgi:hypothetical protein